jgi:2-dehydro-3-deoxyphosphooctonate aldolase (KDO 8-P synthase)
MTAITKRIDIGDVHIGGEGPPLIIAGPCVIESEEITLHTARELKRTCGEAGLGLVFKSSYDKGNRTSIESFRGPGMEKGLRTLSDIKSGLGLPVISDVHSVGEVGPASEVLDVIQIPAFLCRQTDLILAASRTGKPVNIKKGQFLAPWDVRNVIRKFRSAGGEDLILTERGTSFGYNNLVVDFRGLPLMRSYGYPVVFDVTHSLQLPGGLGSSTGGQREFAEPLTRAACAVGVDGLFFEVHPEPDNALCDGPNMIPLEGFGRFLGIIKKISEAMSDGHA